MSSSHRTSVKVGNEERPDSWRITANPNRHGKDNSWDLRIGVLSCLAFTLGCVWILLFPLVTVTTGEAKPRGTFFDENAMLIHHTTAKLGVGDIHWAQPGPLSEAYPQDGARGSEWVCTVLRGMDLPCNTHTFYERPATQSGIRTSIYTVLEPSPGADGKECMVLTTALDLSGTAKEMLRQPSFAGLSLSLSILRQLKDHAGWMSKRLVVLVVDEKREVTDVERLHLGIKSFVDDYHLDTLHLLERHNKDPNMTRSVRHSGVIRAAISLEYSRPGEPKVVQLLTSGVNGELPNMDLLNAAVHHHERQGVRVLLDTCSSSLIGEPPACDDLAGRGAAGVDRLLPPSMKGGAAQRYFERLFAMLGFMGSVAMGPSGPHAHFLRHSIDALTIRSLGATEWDPDRTTNRAAAGLAVPNTVALLNIVRGVSNLEEELHHSFFSYLMLSTSAFVSIGEYAYALALLLFPLAMQGRRLTALNKGKKLPSAVLIVGTFEAFGAVVLWIASAWQEPSEKLLAEYLKVVFLAGYLLLLGVCTCVSTKAPKGLQRPGWEGPKAVMACVLAYSCSVTALLTWQVAAVLALTHVPLLAVARPFKRNSASSWCTALAVAASSPACWMSLLGVITANESSIGVVLLWLRWFRLSGLLNVPLMCLISLPVHLTVVFVLQSPDSQADVYPLS